MGLLRRNHCFIGLLLRRITCEQTWLALALVSLLVRIFCGLELSLIPFDSLIEGPFMFLNFEFAVASVAHRPVCDPPGLLVFLCRLLIHHGVDVA